MGIVFSILSLPVILLTIASLGYLFRIPITPYHFPVALLINVIAVIRFYGPKNEQFKELFYYLSFLIIFGFIASVVNDFSCDGQGYHLKGVLALSSGWNPISNHYIIDGALGIKSHSHVNHFPKAFWIISAALNKSIGNIETGKMFHFLFMVVSFVLVKYFIETNLKLEQRYSIVIGAIVALNPITIVQMNTYYVDGLLASLLTSLIILSINMFFIEKTKVNQFSFLIFLLVILLVNIKFTGLVYSVFFIACTCIIYYLKFKIFNKHFILWSLSGLFVGVIIIGYQPYVTNTLHYHNPFEGAVNILDMSDNTAKGHAPEAFIKKTRVYKMFYSIFSRSDNRSDKYPNLKNPLMTDIKELSNFIDPDTRFGGFGPFFPLVMVFSISIFPFTYKYTKANLWKYGIIFVVMIVSALLIPEPWWARFCPQLYLVPVIILFMFASNTQYNFLKKIFFTGIFFVGINLFVIFSVNVTGQIFKEIEYHKMLECLHKKSIKNPVNVKIHRFNAINRYRMENAKIQFNEIETLTCKNQIKSITPPLTVCVVGGKDLQQNNILKKIRKKMQKYL